MFSASSLSSVLERHDIFEKLKKEIVEKDNENKYNSHAQQLIHITAGNFYVWHEQRSCLLTTNLREDVDDSNEGKHIQTLLCSNAPLFQVQSIIFNDSSSHVALVGSRGVSVLVLPKRWGREAEYEGGKHTITCRTNPVAERFFTCNISVQLIQASWYPDTSLPHLCLLTSDNVFRIYNIQSDPHMPIQTHKLNLMDGSMPLGGSRMSLLSMYSVSSSLGETVVAFDFAPTVEYKPKKNILQRKKQDASLLQPIYLLQGNGDVLLLFTSLTDNKFSRGILDGPLIMLPAAEDNYGTDSCAIHVMKTSPSIVVIATTTGKLYHCIALWSEKDDQIDPTEDLDTQSIISQSLSRINTSVSGDLVPPTLYVYETVELELDLSQSEEEQESHSITLREDPVLPSRYHSCTSVGLHSVALPWLGKIDAFVQADDENKEALTELTPDDHCVVEHVLCTKPTSSSKPCFIKGLTAASDPMLGPSLLCLTNDYHCSALPLLNTFRPPSPQLMSFIEDRSVIASPIKKLSEISFADHVKSLLKREASQPVLRSSEGSTSNKECLQLVTKATQILRDQYMLKQKLAKNAIERRVQLLQEQKEQQISELNDLAELKEQITDRAMEIGESIEERKDRQQALLERLDVVIKRVKSTDPVLSKSEIEMGKELRMLAEKLGKVDNSIMQLRVKQEYQTKKQGSPDFCASFSNKTTDPTGRSLQMDQFKQIILEKGEKISELIKKLNNLNVQVGL